MALTKWKQIDGDLTGSRVLTGSLQLTGSLGILENLTPNNNNNRLRVTPFYSNPSGAETGIYFHGTRTGSYDNSISTYHLANDLVVDVTGSSFALSDHINFFNRLTVNNKSRYDDIFGLYNLVRVTGDSHTGDQAIPLWNQFQITGTGAITGDEVYVNLSTVDINNPNSTVGQIEGLQLGNTLTAGSASAYYALNFQQSVNSNYHITGDYGLIYSNETTVPTVGGSTYNIYLPAAMDSYLGGKLQVAQSITGSDVKIDDFGSVSASLASISSSAASVPTLQQVTDQGATTTNDINVTGSLNTSGSVNVDGNIKVGNGNALATKLYVVGTGDRGGYLQARADGNGSTGIDFYLEGPTNGAFRFDAGVVPVSNLLYNLGNSGAVWNTAYIQTVTGRPNTSQGILNLSSGTTSNPISFQIAGTEYARLHSDGNFGIGTTTVNYNLTSYASGNGNVFPVVAGVGAGANKFVGLGLSNYIAQNGSVKGGFVLERVNSYGTGKIHILNNNDLDNTDADLTDAKLTIDEPGNVGIGTRSPSYTLDVSGSGNFTDGLTVTGSILHDGNLTVSGIVTAEEFHTEFVSASIIFRSGSTKFGDTLDDTHQFTGSVVATSTGSFSHITGDKIFIDNTLDGHQIGKLIIDYQSDGSPTLRADGGDFIRFNSDVVLGSSTNNIYASSNHSADLKFIHERSGDFGFLFSTEDSGSVFRIDGSGNVGIGTTAPSYNLDVTSNGNTTARITSAGTGATQLRFENTGTGFLSALVTDNNGLLRLDATNIQLNPTSNVGIGTSSPSYKLDVSGSGNFADNLTVSGSEVILGVKSTSNTDLSFYTIGTSVKGTLGYSSNGWDLSLASSDYRRLQLENTGLGSIGLNVIGNITGSDIKIDDWGSISASLASITSNDLDGSGTANYVPKWSDSDTLTDSVIYDDGTNVGINTTSPGELFTVNLGSDGDALSLTHAGSNALKIERSGTNDTKIRQYRQFDSKILIETIADGTNQTGLNVVGQGSGNSSYVGIGTNDPQAKLHVKGTGTSYSTTAFRVENLNNSASVRIVDDGSIYQSLNSFKATSFGDNAGKNSNGSNPYFSAFGNASGYSSTSGGYWTSVGASAGYSNTTGNFWNAFGFFAGRLNVTGASWNAIGAYAGENNTGGSNWVAIGYRAARYYSGGTTAADSFSNGVYIGTDVKVGGSGAQNEIVIGHEAEGNGSNTVTLGNDSITDTILKGNVGIDGVTTPSSSLHVGTTSTSNTKITIEADTYSTTSGIELVRGSSVWNIVNNGTFNIFRGASSYLNVGTLGNIGIGTTSPQAKLHVEGDISGSGDLSILGDITASGNIVVEGQYIYGDTTTPYVRLSNSAGAELSYGTSKVSVGGPTTIIDSGTDVMRFRNNKVVSTQPLIIGTTDINATPAAELHVVGDISGSGDVYLGVNGNLRGGQSGGINIYPNQSSGNGRIQVGQSDTVFYAVPRPAVDNNTNLGSLSKRWSTVYAVNLDISGSVTASGNFFAANGTQAAPSYTFIDDPDTGMFRYSANQLALVAGGSTGIRFGTNAVNIFYGSSIKLSTTSTGAEVDGDLTVTGTVTAQEFHTEFVSASIIYESGSTKFGDSIDDIHSFTGSVNVTGSLVVDGDSTANSFTAVGSLTSQNALRTTNGRLQLGPQSSGAGIWLDRTSDDLYWFIGLNNSDGTDLRFYRGGDKVTFTSNGRVGIGTGAPAYSLHVVGGGNFTDGLNITGSLNVTGSSHTIGDALFTNVDSSKDITISGGEIIKATNAFTIQTSISYLRLRATNNSIFFDADAGYRFRNGAGSTEYLRIESDGKVGIGTNSPSYLLDVSGSGNFTDGLNVTGSLNVDGYGYIKDGLRVGTAYGARGGDGNDLISVIAGGSLGAYDFGLRTQNYDNFLGKIRFGEASTNSGYIAFRLSDNVSSTADSEKVRITAAGNVGIGNTSPAAKLAIGSTTYNGNLAITTSNANNRVALIGNIEIGTQSGTWTGQTIWAPGTNRALNFTAGGNLNTSDSSAFVFTGKDNAGRTVDYNTFEIVGGYNAAGLRADYAFLKIGGTIYQANINQSGSVTGIDYDPDLIEISGSHTAARFRAGNVLIEDGNLLVTGSLTASGLIYPTSDGTVGQVIVTDGNGNLSFDSLAAGGSINGTGSANYITRWDGLYSITSSSLYEDSSGNIGIGTNAPERTLHLSSSANNYIRLETSTTNGYAGIEFENDAKTWTLGLNNNDSFVLAPSAQFAGGYPFEVESAAYNDSFIIKSGGNIVTNLLTGNLGVGLDSPTEKLHISGSSMLLESPSYTDSGFTITDDVYDYRFGTTPPTNNTNYFWVKRSSSSTYLQQSSGNWIFQTNNIELVRIASDGKVGIGVTSPSSKLHVSSSTGFGIDTERGIQDGSRSGWAHYYSAGNAHILGRPIIAESSIVIAPSSPDSTTSNYRFLNTTNVLKVAEVIAGVTQNDNILTVSGSNVGIGTASPSVDLDINGTAQVNNELRFTNSEMRIFRSSNDLRFRTANNDRMTIDSSGNVGIGTTTPTEKLHVVGDIKAGDLGRVTLSDSSISVNIYTTLQRDSLSVGLAGTDFTLSTRQSGGTFNTDQLVLKHTGNIGIGTDSPNYTLDVSGSGNFTNGLTVTGSILHDGDLTVTGTVTAEEFHTEFVSASIIYRSGSTKFGDTLDDIHSFTGSLQVSGSTGEVIIGSEANSAIYAYRSGTRSVITVDADSGRSSTLNIEQGGVPQYYVGMPIQDVGGLGSRFAISYQGSPNFVISGNSGIGINKVAPKYDLDVSGSGNFTNDLNVTGSLTLVDGSNYKLYLDSNEVYSQDLDLYLKASQDVVIQPGETTTAHFDASGNVGIGTTSPVAKLHVSSSGTPLRLDGSVYNSTLSYLTFNPGGSDATIASLGGANYLQLKGANGLKLQRNSGTNVTVVLGEDAQNIYADGTSDYISIDTANTERLRIDSSGNVGIGTTSPDSLLTLAGDNAIKFTGVSAQNQTSTIETDSSDNFNITAGLGSGKVITIGEGNRYVKLRSSAFIYRNQAHDFRDYLDAPQLYIDSTGNNPVKVGIGTTSPAYKLDVAGDLRVLSSSINYQENTDVDTGTETIATVNTGSFDGAFFDYLIKSGSNLRAGTVTAIHDGTNVEYSEVSTQDLGSTSVVELSVDISGADMRLKATTTSDDWLIKSLVRTL